MMGRNEDEIVRRIAALFPPSEGTIVGIGDDAAVVDLPTPSVITTDALVEGVDFSSSVSIAQIARKSLGVNLSDLAAMGAEPRAFLLTLVWPKEHAGELEEFATALSEYAKSYAIHLVGGDLSAGPIRMISITAIGATPADSAPLLRSGARAGDRIFVSRPLGGSAAGLALLQRGFSVRADGKAEPPAGRTAGYAQLEFAASAIRRHLDPDPETALGIALARSGAATSCIDISDGLSTDLHRLCEASGVGATVDWERIPVFADLGANAVFFGLDADSCALHGGEEFALLFTSRSRESELSAALRRPVYAIGSITTERGVFLEKRGSRSPLEPQGYDHFA